MATSRTEMSGKHRVPAPLLRYKRSDVAGQIVKLDVTRWRDVFIGREALHHDLVEHVRTTGGICRSFIHERSRGDAVGLFLLAMAWGYEDVGYGPYRTRQILTLPKSDQSIRRIVEVTQSSGVEAGWDVLFGECRLNGLNLSFGTKLLYFAGYKTDHRPRPLILDDRARWSLYDLKRGTVPAPGRGTVTKGDYLRYCHLAEVWASDLCWKQEPDVVEYGLYALNGVYESADNYSRPKRREKIDLSVPEINWPSGDHDLIRYSHTSRHTFDAAWNRGNLSGYGRINGFKLGADIIYQQIVEDNRWYETAWYAYAFCCRHTIELQLKALLPQFRSLLGEKQRDAFHHDILKLWQELKPLIIKALPDEPKDYKHAERIIKQFNMIDPDGEELRYDTRRGDKSKTLTAIEIIDIDQFHLAADAVITYLETLEIAVLEHLGFKREMESEFLAE